jgi:CheY-like chemotaxis protein
VLVNLLGNAIKFTERGHVLVRLGAHEGGRVLVTVQDSGIGIADDVRDKLFKRFVQADAGTTRRFGGTGLGLAISRQLVGLMGGEIGVRSELGSGSAFWFSLLAAADQSQLEADPPCGADLDGLRVLVVDDLEPNRRMLQQFLQRWKVQCELADSADAALPLLEAARAAGREFDLAIVDHCMPGIDGEQFGRGLREQHRADAMALLMFSSSLESGAAERLGRLGFDGYLTKPLVEAARLAEAIRDARSHRESVLADRTLTMPAPRFAGPTVDRASTSTSAPASRAGAAGVPVLLVEDNAVNRMLAEKFLEDLGCTVELAEDGVDAVEREARGHYAVIFMDCHMPRMDGFTATARIRERQAPLGRRTPIVALTAGVTPEERDKCLAAGMDDFVAKPIVLAELRQCLRRWTASPGAERGAPAGAGQRA